MFIKCKWILPLVSVLFSTSAFALIPGMNHIDVLGFGGYSQIDQWSGDVTDANKAYATMTGYDVGGMFLFTFSDSIISPTIGAGLDYSLWKSTTEEQTLGYKAVNTFSSQAATGHAGFRMSVPFIRAFVLGNVGFGTSSKFDSEITPFLTNVKSTINAELKDHMFYGATVAGLVSLAPFIKIGLMGLYNQHTASYKDVTLGTTSTQAQKTSFQEVSGNLVIDINL
jgi:hypothetical protein